MQVENDVKMPESLREWPFHLLKVGDSVWFPADRAKLAQVTAHAYGSNRKKRFATRRESGGLRVWRVE